MMMMMMFYNSGAPLRTLQAIETNTRVYIVMEEATGGSMLSSIQKLKRIPEKQAGIWFRQILDGIDYCHQRGIAHRDLCCDNLLLDLKVFFPRFQQPVIGLHI